MSVKYTRQCNDWLIDFARWTLPRGEAPESFIFWTGLFVLAAALRRHVSITKKYLGSWEASPNIYVMFVARPGMRKSTTVDYAEELLSSIPDITPLPERITKEDFLNQLVKSPDRSVYILAKEFGEFIVKSGHDMYGLLTDGYDGKRKMDASTLSRGKEYVERPCINLIGATTPDWIAENMPQSVIGGGFASRPVFLYEEDVRLRRMFFDHLNQEQLDELKLKLLADLSHIAHNIHGEFVLPSEVKDYIENWYQVESKRVKEVDPKLQGFIERKPALVLKVAMLRHIARSDSLELSLSSVKEAIEIVDLAEPKIAASFQSIGKNPYTADIKSIFRYIRDRGKVYEIDIKREFFHVAMPENLDKILVGLVESGFVTMAIDASKPEGRRRFYTANGEAPKR